MFTSKSVGTGPSSYEKTIYPAAVSQRLRNTGVRHSFQNSTVAWRYRFPRNGDNPYKIKGVKTQIQSNSAFKVHSHSGHREGPCFDGARSCIGIPIQSHFWAQFLVNLCRILVLRRKPHSWNQHAIPKRSLWLRTTDLLFPIHTTPPPAEQCTHFIISDLCTPRRRRGIAPFILNLGTWLK